LCGDTFSLADASAAPYVLRIRNMGLQALWKDKASVEDWLERVLDRVNNYALEDAWGSDAFHAMVAGYVKQSQADIDKLIEDRL